MRSCHRNLALRLSVAFVGALVATVSPLAAQTKPDLEMWRLDCGSLEISDVESFSDAHLYDGKPKTLTDSCYLIRHGDRYMLWDTGLSADLVKQPYTWTVYTMSLRRTLVDQLAQLGLNPEDIDIVGISHMHFDHVAQAKRFPGAELVIGSADADAIAAGKDEDMTKDLANWFGEGATGKVTRVAKDKDVFGDGSVTMIATPGHTPGHSSLLVRLPRTGPVLLTGDLYHFTEQVENRGVPQFNTNRADTLASMDRFDRTARALNAKVVIQHEQAHVALLPAFPASAK